MKKNLIMIISLLILALFILSSCSSGDAIKGIKSIDLNSQPYSDLGVCSDTDNGVNSLVYGVVTVENISNYWADFCLNNVTLTEFFCNASNVGSVLINCSGFCNQGACIEMGNSQDNFSCIDSDGGIAPTMLGQVTTNGVIHVDSCKNNFTLTEYYCDNNQSRSVLVECANACVNGECSPKNEINDLTKPELR